MKAKKNKARRADSEEIIITHAAPAGDTKTKKKKKKRTVEGATGRLERRTEKLNAALRTIDIEEIARNVHPGEREVLEEYVWMFNKIGRLIRRTEKRALKSGQSRDIYALSTLISQQREIIADIRTLSDMSGQIELFKNQVLQPMSSSLAQNMLDSYYQLRRLIMEVVKPKETQFALGKLEAIVKEMSKFLQLQYQESSVRVDHLLSGDIDTAGPSAPKKKKKRRTKVGE